MKKAGAARREGGRSTGPPSSQDVIIDTGVLVALYARDDPMHEAISQWLGRFKGALHTVEAVLTEVAFFLPARIRPGLAELACNGTLNVHFPDAAGYARIGALLKKYGDLDPDWADVSLVWLAETTGVSRIATIDVSDFSTYRIHGRSRFELELLR